MANDWIKAYAKKQHIKLWEVADAMGIHEVSLSRKLRYDLPPDEQQRIKDIIDRLKSEKKR